MKRRKTGFFAEISRNNISYLLVLPAVLYTFVFGYCTLPYLIMAFQKFSYSTNLFTARWIGLHNFQFFLQSQRAAMVTINTLRLNALYIVFNTGLAVLLALFLNEMRSRRFSKVLQSFYIFPYFLSWVIVSYIVYAIFSTDKGLLNEALKGLGAPTHSWYNDARPWTLIITALRVWKDVGMTSVIYLAALSGLDREIFEAAMVDGASRSQQIFRLTIPLILPIVAMLTLLSIGRIFYGDFAMIYSIVRDNGLLFPTTDVIDTYVYRALRLTGDPAQAMAANLYQSVMGFLMVFGSNWLVRRFFPEGALF